MLNHDDARIVSQRPVELPVPDVERDHPCGTALENASVNPPVDAPISSASRPVTMIPNESRACASSAAASDDTGGRARSARAAHGSTRGPPWSPPVRPR